jgi:hypothetical protein
MGGGQATRSFASRLAIALACAFAVAGCDGTLPPGGTTTSASVCSAATWTPIADLGVHSVDPMNLVLAGDTFYYTSSHTLMSVPASGGSPTALSDATIGLMWLDGQALDFVYDTDQLQQIPLAGGAPTVVADGMTIGVAPDYAVAGAFAFDGQYLYWDLHPPAGSAAGWSAWRMSAAGGAAEQLADLPPPAAGDSNLHTLTPTPGGLLVAVQHNISVAAYLVPPSGGSPATLPVPPSAGTSSVWGEALLGAGPSGVVWETDADATTLNLTDLTDPAMPVLRPLWTDLPSTLITVGLRAIPGGDDGSWIISGSERFDDGQEHVSVWSVDAAGNGVRLGCDPDADTNSAGAVTAVLPTPTAVFAIAAAGNISPYSYDFELVRLAR